MSLGIITVVPSPSKSSVRRRGRRASRRVTASLAWVLTCHTLMRADLTRGRRERRITSCSTASPALASRGLSSSPPSPLPPKTGNHFFSPFNRPSRVGGWSGSHPAARRERRVGRRRVGASSQSSKVNHSSLVVWEVGRWWVDGKEGG